MNGWLDEIDLRTNNKFFNCPELLFLFLKGMTAALAPFSYLVDLRISQRGSKKITLLINIGQNLSFSLCLIDLQMKRGLFKSLSDQGPML